MKNSSPASRDGSNAAQAQAQDLGTAEGVAAMHQLPQSVSVDSRLSPKGQAMMDGSLQNYVGKTLRVRFLTSDKGKDLNERMCTGIGHNGERVRVIMKEGGQTHLLKMANLLQDSAEYRRAPGSGIGDAEIIVRLQRVHEHFNEGGPGAEAFRADQLARRAFLAKNLGTVPPPWKCLDSGVPEHEMDPFLKFLASVKPCCCGDGTVDFRRFSAGLVGNSEECSICLEKLSPADTALALPCKHMFHAGCAGKWLDNNNTCPTCRSELPCPSSEYIYEFGDYERVVTCRLNEFVVGGMCEMCQATYMEADPLMPVPDANGINILVQRSKLGEYLAKQGNRISVHT